MSDAVAGTVNCISDVAMSDAVAGTVNCISELLLVILLSAN